MTTYQSIADTDVEAGKYSPSILPSSRPVYTNRNTNSVIVKAKIESEKWGKARYRQFEVPVDFPLSQLVSVVKERFDILDETGADMGTAYLLWFFFGWLGLHRWYLKQHNALSWLVWFFTGQLFGFGWFYDGATLHLRVKEFNSRSLNRLNTEHHKQDWLSGFKEDERPSMVAAYLLWFFFGFFGIHRWYTGHQTPTSFVAWFCTLQIFGFGWLYDAYYTSVMVNYPRLHSHHIPFFVKCFMYDYLPITTDEQLGSTLQNAFSDADRTARIIIVSKKREDVAYLLWFFGGYIGAHAWYLGMGNLFVRFFTANYFVFGYIADGIRLSDEINRANEKLQGDFVPSLKGTWAWPMGYSPSGYHDGWESV